MHDESHFLPEGDPARVLTAILEASEDAIITANLDGVIQSWNRGAERLFGYAADEMRGRSASVLMPKGSDELTLLLDRLKAGVRVEPYEAVRVAKDGRLLDVSVAGSPVLDASGRIIGALAIARDIAGRKRTDLALRTTEARWRAVIDSAVDGIVVIDAKGAIEAFNPAAERLFGYEEREALGRNVNMLMPSPYHEDHDRYIAHYIETGVQKIIGIGREVTGLRRDGTTFPCRLSVGEMRVGGDRRFTGIIHDLSERVQLEERLREQRALAHLGEMAAIIAHEVKNPLTAVRGAIQVIGGRLPADSKEAPVVKEIVARLDALNGLIKDLLLFARPPRPRLAPLEIVPLLELTADLLGKDPAFSRVRMEVTGTAPPILGDADLLKIVFQNLFINAAQAMQGRGVVRAAVIPDDRMHYIRITDAGPGIPPDVREKLFRPFFTTKARGTGLGLSTAKRLVEAHAGTITIECPPEGGTIVTIELPATSSVPA